MGKQAGVENVSVLEGSIAATGRSNPFTPGPGNTINLTLSGTWVGTVALERSFDGGTTIVPCTLAGAAVEWTANISEPVWQEPEDGVLLYLNFTRTSGTVGYRFGEVS